MTSSEHRAHQRLQQYWDHIKGSKLLPSEDQINADDIADIWTSCFLISIDDVTRRLGYRYSYLGTDLIEAFSGDSTTPPDVLHMLSTVETPMIKRFDAVRQDKKPVLDEAEFVNLKGLKIKYRTSMMPLGNDKGDVSHIIGCMRWKVC